MEDFFLYNLSIKIIFHYLLGNLMLLESSQWVIDLAKPLLRYYRLLGALQECNDLLIF